MENTFSTGLHLLLQNKLKLAWKFRNKTKGIFRGSWQKFEIWHEISKNAKHRTYFYSTASSNNSEVFSLSFSIFFLKPISQLFSIKNSNDLIGWFLLWREKKLSRNLGYVKVEEISFELFEGLMVNLMLGTKIILMKYNSKINAKQNYTHFPSNFQNSAFQYPGYEGCVMKFFPHKRNWEVPSNIVKATKEKVYFKKRQGRHFLAKKPRLKLLKSNMRWSSLEKCIKDT